MHFYHPWDLTPRQASALQADLAGKVVIEGEPAVNIIGGVDVHPAGGNGMIRAVITLLSFPALEPLERQSAMVKEKFPYVPGLLSFREGPAVMAAFQKLKHQPDLMLFDGQGIAHPRRFGLASHMGLLLDIPSIGCAKSRLFGTHDEPGKAKGEFAYLLDKQGEIIGAAMRTRDGVKPVYVSVGHHVGLDFALRTVLDCCTKYRIPEPLRLAHKAAKGGEE